MFTGAQIWSHFIHEATLFGMDVISRRELYTKPNSKWRHMQRWAALQKMVLNKIILIIRFSVYDLSQ